MSDENSRLKRTLRRKQKRNHIAKQIKILKDYYYPANMVPHKLHKKHALNCGNPHCILCSNPRKFGFLTIQEIKENQKIKDEAFYYGQVFTSRKY